MPAQYLHLDACTENCTVLAATAQGVSKARAPLTFMLHLQAQREIRVWDALPVNERPPRQTPEKTRS